VANLKAIRKRISSVKSTQKITRAMKMVAGARLSRAQHRILAMRPYAVGMSRMLSEVVQGSTEAEEQHALLTRREDKRTLVLLVSSDRGLCGGFNANISKFAEAFWREKRARGEEVVFACVGRRGRDYLKRRGAPLRFEFDGVWDDLGLHQARRIARELLPLASAPEEQEAPAAPADGDAHGVAEYIFEPDRGSLLARLVPMYIEITILRALYESMASELGARMTAMDSATKNAQDMIDRLTLQYNRQRQAVITTELIEIVAGAEALQA
jgi:F-type H+-transporting ATPase subunit gamma